jgi:hypothetical protein
VDAPDNLRDLFTFNEKETIDPRLHAALSDPAELAKLIESPAWGVFTFPFLQPKFCDALMWFSDVCGDYKPDPDDPYGGRELSTPRVDQLHNVMRELFDRYMTVLTEICFDGFGVTAINGSFVLRYSMDTQKSMGCHFDDNSDVSLTVALNDKFTGGGLSFPRYEWTSNDLKPGSAVMFPGRVTHRHEGLAIESGERYALVFWLTGRENGL